MYPNYFDSKIDANWDEFWEQFSYRCAFLSQDGVLYEKDGVSIPAGTKGKWIFTIKNLSYNCNEEITFRFGVMNGSLGLKAQTTKPKAINFLEIASETAGTWVLDPNISGFQNCFSATLTNGTFAQGETLQIELGGNQSCAEIYWTESDVFIVLEARLHGKVLPVGKKPFTYHIQNRTEVALIRLLLPTCATPHIPFHVCCGVFDCLGNVIKDFEGTVSLAFPEGVAGLPKSLSFQKENQGNFVIEGVTLSQEKVYRIDTIYQDHCFTSNPCVVKKEHDCNIYWGDLHAHGYGDCTMHLMHMNTDKIKPNQRHLQGRDIGRFDFGVIGPMSFPTIHREEIWQKYVDAVNEFDADGRYVPYLSYEAHPAEEDRVIIYKNLQEKLPLEMRSDMKTLMEQVYPREDVLVECHIGGATPKWEKNRPQREDFVEISSAFGNAEWLLHHAISYGYRPAVCGCSDLHMGLYGGPKAVELSRGRFARYLWQRDSAYGTGPLTAVLSTALNRDVLFNAMKAKSTYASSGERIYLMATLDGQLPGSELEEKTSYNCRIRCCGTREIHNVQIISGKRVIFEAQPNQLDIDLSVTLSNLPADFMYVRVVQNDGSYVWSTPFYINETQPQWDSPALSYLGNAETASAHLADVITYLQTEENAKDFTHIEPLGMQKETVSRCAIFKCRYKGMHDLLIKWYPDYEVPKIRLDWGHSYSGVVDDEVLRQTNHS